MEARNIYSSQTTMLAVRHMKIHAQEERPFIANLKSPVIVKNHHQMDKFSCNIRLHPQDSCGRQSDLISFPDCRFKESVTQKTD